MANPSFHRLAEKRGQSMNSNVRCFKLSPKTEELIGVLDELAAVLEEDGNVRWGGWMRKARARLLNSDYSGIEYFLSAYGGMGSMNDVIVGQRYKNGVLEWRSGHIELNQKFNALSAKALKLADAIKRSH